MELWHLTALNPVVSHSQCTQNTLHLQTAFEGSLGVVNYTLHYTNALRRKAAVWILCQPDIMEGSGNSSVAHYNAT